MIKLETHTWVLVADGEKALFLRNDGGAMSPDLSVQRVEQQDNPRQADQVSDRPGRRADPGIGQRSAMEEADWHQLAKDRFAAELSDILARMVQKGRITRLVLVAPPKTLGELRQQLHDTVLKTVIAELPKTLTGHSLPDIRRIVTTDLEQMVHAPS
jgi:protein required for attachment to host cells